MFGKKKDKEYKVIAVYNDYRHHKTFKTLPEAEVYVKELQEKAKKNEIRMVCNRSKKLLSNRRVSRAMYHNWQFHYVRLDNNN